MELEFTVKEMHQILEALESEFGNGFWEEPVYRKIHSQLFGYMNKSKKIIVAAKKLLNTDAIDDIRELPEVEELRMLLR